LITLSSLFGGDSFGQFARRCSVESDIEYEEEASLEEREEKETEARRRIYLKPKTQKHKNTTPDRPN